MNFMVCCKVKAPPQHQTCARRGAQSNEGRGADFHVKPGSQVWPRCKGDFLSRAVEEKQEEVSQVDFWGEKIPDRSISQSGGWSGGSTSGTGQWAKGRQGR